MYPNTATRLALPNEILDQIIRSLPHKTQITCLCVSRTFNSLGNQYVYRDLSLDSLNALLRCFTSLYSNDRAAKAVRTLYIDAKNTSEDDSAVPMERLVREHIISDVLQKISPHIVELSIRNLPEHYVACISGGFPSMRAFVYHLNMSLLTVEFLTCNPQLRELYLYGKSHVAMRYLHPIPFTLPALHTLAAPPALVPFMLQRASAVTRVELVVNAMHVTYLSAMAAAEAMVCSNITESLGFYGEELPVWILELISRYFSDVQVLYFGCVQDVGSESCEELYHGLPVILPQLKSLRRLELEPKIMPGSWVISRALLLELQYVSMWADSCSSLREISMPTKTQWIRKRQRGRSVWHPLSPEGEMYETANYICDTISNPIKSHRRRNQSYDH